MTQANNTIDFSNGIWEDANHQPVSNPIQLSEAGLFSYTFVSEPSGYCGSSRFTVNLTVSSPYYAGSDSIIHVCNTSDPQWFTSWVSSNGGSANGHWTYNNILIDDDTFDPQVDPSGIYVYSVPSNGACPADTAMIDIQIQYGIDYSAGEDLEVCSGSAPMELGQSLNNNWTYQWSPSTNLSSTTVANPLLQIPINMVQPQTTTYTVIVNDGVCQQQDQVVVTINPRPISNLPNEYQICRGESVTLAVTGQNIACDWLPLSLFNGSQLPYQIIAPTTTTHVEVIIANEWNCTVSDTTIITVHQLPVVDFQPISSRGCTPLIVQYSYEPNPGEMVTWRIPSQGNFYGNQFTTTLWQPGTYDLEMRVTSSYGCANTIVYQNLIEVYPKPYADFEFSPEEITTVRSKVDFTNTSNGAIQYFWDFDDGSSSMEISPTHDFTNNEPRSFDVCLEATNNYGCKDTVCHDVLMINEFLFFAPTCITPNNDGINDGFLPVLSGFDNQTYVLRVFNRWGEEIFVTHDVNEPWMANTNRGEYYVPDGIYLWRVEVKEQIRANFEVFEGHVVVIR